MSRHGERGQSLVETALILPVFLVILLGIFDFGRAVYAFNTVGNAARSGGRVAIVNQDTATVQGRAIAEAVALGTTAADVSICYESSASTLRHCPRRAGDPASSPCTPVEIGCLALVEVRYSFSALTPLIGVIVGPITVSSTTVLPVEHVTP